LKRARRICAKHRNNVAASNREARFAFCSQKGQIRRRNFRRSFSLPSFFFSLSFSLSLSLSLSLSVFPVRLQELRDELRAYGVYGRRGGAEIPRWVLCALQMRFYRTNRM